MHLRHLRKQLTKLLLVQLQMFEYLLDAHLLLLLGIPTQHLNDSNVHNADKLLMELLHEGHMDQFLVIGIVYADYFYESFDLYCQQPFALALTLQLHPHT